MATTERPLEDTERPLEDELHQLEREEHELEERADRLSLAGGLALIFAILALVVGVTALTIALIANGKNGGKSSASKAASTQAAPATTKPPAPGIASGKVDVKLGELFVRPNAQVVRAGKVAFTVANTGKLTHEMVVVPSPVKTAKDGSAKETGSPGEVPELQPGKSGRVTIQLKPGSYQLLCNVPGHYAAGQHTNITVK